MGHEDFSLIQVVTDFLKEKWPEQPFMPRRELKGCSPISRPITALDYDHYGIKWPCIYVSGDVVYVVKAFEDPKAFPGSNVYRDNYKTQLSAADPLFFDQLSDAINWYLTIVREELFLP